ncbi:ESPR-type extended signal peptide-containing protein [Klebsiella quasipneumoniae]
MNKIFKVIWNPRTSTHMAVSDFAKGACLTSVNVKKTK